MANLVRYQSRRPVSIKKVKAFLARATSEIPGYKPFEPGDLVLARLHPETLPELEALDPRMLRITGLLDRRKEPWDLFRQVLASYSGSARLTVSVRYESREIAQRRNHGDWVRAGFREGMPKFHYLCNAAHAIGPARHFAVIEELLRVADLPLELHDRGEGFRGEQFFLTHASGGDLWIGSAQLPHRRNPDSFICDMPQKSIEERVAALADVVDQLGSGRRFEYAWSLGSSPDDPKAPEQSRQIYAQVKEAPDVFQAKKLEIVMDTRLDSLEDLELLPRLCGPKDKVLTDLGGFRESDVNPVGIDLITRQDGFWIEVDAEVAFETSLLSSLLGESLVTTAKS